MQIHRKQIAWRKLVLSFLTAVFILGLGWNNGVSSEVINIGWTGEYWSTLPFRVAADKGFFEREGLQARFITMRTSLITPALMQGDLDFTVALPSIAGAALHGVPAKILGVVSKGTGYAIVSKPEIESVQGLKGRKFGINSFGASDDYTVCTFLSKSGLDPTRDVTFLSIGGTSARFAALNAGVVDAAAVSSPFEYKAEQSGLRILVPFKETAEHVKLSNAGLAVDPGKDGKGQTAKSSELFELCEQQLCSFGNSVQQASTFSKELSI